MQFAYLAGANLTRAKLVGANLRGANLTNANLTDAIGADLTGAIRSRRFVSSLKLSELPRARRANLSGFVAAAGGPAGT